MYLETELVLPIVLSLFRKMVVSGTATTLVSYANSFDGNNNLKSENRNGVVTNTGYDAASQVTSNGNNNYSYDKNGNRTTTGFTTGADNRVSSDGTCNYSYDAEGNVSQKVNISSGVTWQYTYNLRNQILTATELTSVTGGTVLESIAYTYDVFGDLLSEVTTSGSNVTTVKHAYMINDVSTGRNATTNTEWAQLDANGNVMVRYLTDGNGTILAQTQFAASGQGVGAGVIEYLSQDHVGNTREVVDASGNVLDAITYDAFGNITAQTNSAYQPMYLFGGMYLDTAKGMYFAHWRVYNTGTGQWMQEDPMGFGAGDTNLRRYVGNNGVNGDDTSGFIKVTTLTKKPVISKKMGWIVDWRYGLDKQATQDGYIVQKVTQTLELTAINRKGQKETIRQTNVFWEAFPVKKGESLSTIDAALGYTDRSSRKELPLSGNFTAVGEIKFFFKTTTGDLGDPAAKPKPILANPNTGFINNNQATRAGDLPSTANEPKWWKKASDQGEVTGARSVNASWGTKEPEIAVTPKP